MSSVGRNDPCPCGSGRKWKKCCGAPWRGSQIHTFESDADKGALFGPGAAFLRSMLDSFAQAAEPRSYRIMPFAEFATVVGIAERNQVYWSEILFRTHFAACTGMLRLNEWLHGSERALADGNVLMLAAGIRGFLEACADTFHGFSDVASTLADCHMVARKAINGEFAEQLALAPELESALIHFSYARKLSPGEGPHCIVRRRRRTAFRYYLKPHPMWSMSIARFATTPTLQPQACFGSLVKMLTHTRSRLIRAWGRVSLPTL